MSDRIPTLADICSAIAEGHIAAAVDGPMYQISVLELRRYFSKLRPLPTISTTNTPDPSPNPNSTERVSVIRISVA